MKFSDFMKQNIDGAHISFHMPGHKGRGIFDVHGMGEMVDRLSEMDITEIPGADNLFQQEGIIRNLMDRYRALYGSKETFLSIGGSTAGLIASIFSTAKRGGRIAISRNAHKSVFNGVRLAGAKPVYVYPEILDGFGISGEIKPEALMAALDRAKSHAEEARKHGSLDEGEKEAGCSAVVITSPNYYGVTSNIGDLAEIAHSKGALLIVDQAHGAHLKFMERDLAAYSGDSDRIPDIVVESTHKTLASFTQTALVNVYNESLIHKVGDALQMIESTSPSYILMESLDLNAELMEKYGKELFKEWMENLEWFYERAEVLTKKGTHIFTHPRHDKSKILIDMSGLGIDGPTLQEELIKRNIVPELTAGNLVMCMSGIGNTQRDYKALLDALNEISCGVTANTGSTTDTGSRIGEDHETDTGGSAMNTISALMNKIREQREIPEEYEILHYTEAEGGVSVEGIIPYPPGAPLIAPGEIMDRESLEVAAELRSHGEKVMGMTEEGMVKAGVTHWERSICKN